MPPFVDRETELADLSRLQDLYLVYRETPATIPEGKQTTQGRYYLRDAYLRFYFRFIAPHERLLEQGLIPRLWEIIRDQLRAFVGMTAFEELCREWVLRRATRGELAFLPDRVGSHFSAVLSETAHAYSIHRKAN